MKLELFKMQGCPYCNKVLNYISKTGRTDIEIVDIDEVPGANARLVREGGLDQVPCLFIDGKPMYESGDIVHWLSQNPQN